MGPGDASISAPIAFLGNAFFEAPKTHLEGMSTGHGGFVEKYSVRDIGLYLKCIFGSFLNAFLGLGVPSALVTAP